MVLGRMLLWTRTERGDDAVCPGRNSSMKQRAIHFAVP